MINQGEVIIIRGFPKNPGWRGVQYFLDADAEDELDHVDGGVEHSEYHEVDPGSEWAGTKTR